MPISDFRVDTVPVERQICSLERSIWSWANAYKVSFSIFALNELGVLKLIATSFLAPAQIADQLDLSEELLTPLLELLASTGVLQEREGAFRGQQGIETILPLLVMESRLSASHVTSSQIAKVVRSGLAADIFQTGNVEEYLPIFTAAMRSSARTLAPHLVRFGNLRQCRQVLDLGGADGSLALALCRVVPQLSISVVDLPRMQQPFEKQIREHGAEHAIHFHSADLRQPETLAGLLGTADVILISNVVHLLTTEHRFRLYRTVQQHAAAGTRFVVYDQFIGDNAPLSGTDFMAVDWVINGVQFRETPEQLCEILRESGFSHAQSRQFPGLPGAVVIAQV
ncbi:MAG TPA: class I SAM-dependent methyltransferase [Candidatus Angelobacter sp.]|jgi:predicted nicotinamide N-methyase|nr:class I SAM-dependent methyltransferase [Candidatus Angelobacter sp.]